MAVRGAGGAMRGNSARIRMADNGGRVLTPMGPSPMRHRRRRVDDNGTASEQFLMNPGRTKISGSPNSAKVTLRA